MIGQQNLINKINRLIETEFPRFVILTGPKGQGKRTIAKYIATQLKSNIIELDIKVDSIREAIKLSYEYTEPIIYLIPDADRMSLGAKNSLLKVIEEPPNNAYFILTLQTLQNTLKTIQSRCIHLPLNNYSEDELLQFINSINLNLPQKDKELILSIATNKYQIQKLLEYDINKFYVYIEKVAYNIFKVQSANAFKITEQLDIKNDGSGYNIKLFFQAYCAFCINEVIKLMDLEDSSYKIWCNCILVTNKWANKLNITGINKQSLLDMWILEIRKVWKDNESI